jgi:DNA-directed RNA polymerase specialized sigma24 family protein
MSQDEQSDDELLAAFEALGGQLTSDELARLLGSGRYPAGLMRLAKLLLDGDPVAAEEVVQASLASLRERQGRLARADKARTYLYQTVVNRTRSMQRQAVRTAGGQAGLIALPRRQHEAVVLCNLMGMSVEQAAAAMSISTGAARSHLARGTSSLRSPPG